MNPLRRLKGKKIFLALVDDESFGLQWHYFHYIEELKHYGVEFEIFNIKNMPSEDFESPMVQILKERAKEFSFFFTGLNDGQLSVQTIKFIKSLGIPTVLICFDNLSIPYAHRKLAPHFDLVWLTSYETEPLFRRWGSHTVVLPYAANPYRFLRSSDEEIPCVGFIGKLYGARRDKIKILSDHSIPTRIYADQSNNGEEGWSQPKILFLDKISSGWNLLSKKKSLMLFDEGRVLIRGDIKKAFTRGIHERTKLKECVQFLPSPSFEDMIKLYTSFSLSIGITEVWNTYLLNTPLYKLHLRTFEIPMCGGLQITHRTKELEGYFTDNKEIIMYDSEEEMIDKMKYYLHDSHRAQRQQLKQAARMRAEKDHCWKNRFEIVEEHLF